MGAEEGGAGGAGAGALAAAVAGAGGAGAEWRYYAEGPARGALEPAARAAGRALELLGGLAAGPGEGPVAPGDLVDAFLERAEAELDGRPRAPPAAGGLPPGPSGAGGGPEVDGAGGAAGREGAGAELDFEHVALVPDLEGPELEAPGGVGLGHPLGRRLAQLRYPAWLTQPEVAPQRPRGFGATPFEFVDTPAALRRLAQRLEEPGCREIAVDLENHSQHSFLGFLCLMQVSTRERDYIVDVLKLRDEVGPALAGVFADASKVKVLHGADCDVVWLQRCFSIYIVNLFDTGQAARVLGLPCSLAACLQRYCGVKANKRYQMADWRTRPLPQPLLDYARGDTHYLLYVFDRLREDLLRQGPEVPAPLAVPIPAGQPGGSLGTALQRSRQLCYMLYEPPTWQGAAGFMPTYKRAKGSLNPRELTAYAALYRWRFEKARALDESTGHVMPNALLLKVARRQPQDTAEARRLCGPSSLSGRLYAAEVARVVQASEHEVEQVMRAVQEYDASKAAAKGETGRQGRDASAAAAATPSAGPMATVRAAGSRPAAEKGMEESPYAVFSSGGPGLEAAPLQQQTASSMGASFWAREAEVAAAPDASVLAAMRDIRSEIAAAGAAMSPRLQATAPRAGKETAGTTAVAGNGGGAVAAPEGEDEDRAAELKSFVEGMIREKAENTEAQKPEGAKESKKRDEKLPQPISAMPGPRAGKRKVQGVAHQGYAGAEQPVLSEPKASYGASMQKRKKNRHKNRQEAQAKLTAGESGAPSGDVARQAFAESVAQMASLASLPVQRPGVKKGNLRKQPVAPSGQANVYGISEADMIKPAKRRQQPNSGNRTATFK